MHKGLGKEAGGQGESRPCGRARNRRGGFVAKDATGRTRRKWRGAPFQNPQYWGRQANWAGGARCLDAAPNAAGLGASLGRGEDRRLARPFEGTGETGVDGKTRNGKRRDAGRRGLARSHPAICPKLFAYRIQLCAEGPFGLFDSHAYFHWPDAFRDRDLRGEAPIKSNTTKSLLIGIASPNMRKYNDILHL